MRFMTLYKPGNETNVPPTAEEMARMGALIGEMAGAGVLLAADGLQPSATGARVRLGGNGFSITDGPFTEAKELIAGFAILQVPSKAEAIEWTKRFLTVAGGGESEIREMHDEPAFPPQ